MALLVEADRVRVLGGSGEQEAGCTVLARSLLGRVHQAGADAPAAPGVEHRHTDRCAGLPPTRYVTRAASGGRFEATLLPALDLIKIHKRNPNPGLRVEDLSLNRGAVVFAVAAWQTYVQSLTEAILAGMAPPPGDPALGVYQLLAGSIRSRITQLSTPDANKSLGLLSSVNFDPSPAWAFTFQWERQHSHRYGSVKEAKTLRSGDARRELDGWLKIRHSIAHGDRLPTNKDLISGSARGGESRLWRRDADRCTSFFQALVAATSAEAHKAFP